MSRRPAVPRRPRGPILALAVTLSAATLSPPGAGAAEAAAAPWFVDVAADTGLDFVHFNGMAGKLYFPEIFGSGAALFDYDGDGDLDVFLAQGALLERGGSDEAVTLRPAPARPGGRLYRNDLAPGPGGAPLLRFTDVTEASGLRAAGYGMGAATGDYDGDGWIDLYVTNFGSNQLFRNRGDGTFEDVTAAAGADDPRWSVPAVFFDYDRDGHLDLFVGNYVEFTLESHKLCRTLTGAPDYCGPLTYRPQPDRLLRNRGDGTFEDVSPRAGLREAYGAGLGAVAADFDGDGWSDLYVANDGMPNQLWINRRDGRFEESALISGTAVNRKGEPEASMGVAAGDFDGDGDEDLVMTHLSLETNTVYVNDGTGLFEDATVATGLGMPSWEHTGFGAAWLDFDNDGLLDLVTANGAVRFPPDGAGDRHGYPLEQPDQLFRNLGGGRFAEVTAEAGDGFRRSEVGRGVAVGDVDNDGDTDVLIVNNSGPVRLLENRKGDRRQWLGLRLLSGDPGRDALGARVGVVLAGGRVLWRRADTGGSYASATDPRVLVGLGDSPAVEAVEVLWPGGRRERFPPPPVGRYSVLREGGGAPAAAAPPAGRPPAAHEGEAAAADAPP